MRPWHRSRRRNSALKCAVVSLVLGACRLGYDEQPSLGVAGSSGASSGVGNGASASAGNGSSSGAGNAGNAGTSSEGGQSPGGSSFGGVTAMAGAGGAGVVAGAAGEGGATPIGDCQPTASCSCEAFGGHTYWVCATAAMSSVAIQQCATQGMTLVRIDSQAENDFLLTVASAAGMLPVGGFVLIGADDQAVDGEWRWVDGEQFWQGSSNGVAVGGLYSNWLGSSPTNSGIKACAGMVPDGQWQDRSCTSIQPYICEGP